MTGRFNRRSFLLAIAAVPLAGTALAAGEQPLQVKVYKDASCGCCGGWIDHMRKAGFTVEASDMPDMEAVKKTHKVPESLYSCHTAVIGSYIVEGHVPVAAIRRLLAEKPDIIGLSAPGMPVGSPGMESPDGYREPYEIVAFDSGGTKLFARFVGDKEV